jgi:hypothetical protein
MVLDICAGLGYGATLSPRFPESRGELLSERLELERLPQERQGGGTQAIDGSSSSWKLVGSSAFGHTTPSKTVVPSRSGRE